MAMAEIISGCPLSLRASFQVCVSQKYNVRSTPPVTRNLPSGVNSMANVATSTSLIRRTSSPSLVFQMRTSVS